MSNLDYYVHESAVTRYGISKAGNLLLNSEFVGRYRDEGIISVWLMPGALVSDSNDIGCLEVEVPVE